MSSRSDGPSPQNLREGEGAWFNQSAVLEVGTELIARLKSAALSSPTRRFRLCLHRQPSDWLQEMIVAHCRDNYSRPHRHPSPLTYLILEGQMRLLLFDDVGSATDTIELGAFTGQHSFSIRVEAHRWYMPVCISPQLVFFEIKQGAFERDRSNEWAPWSPAEDDPEAILAYRKRLGIE